MVAGGEGEADRLDGQGGLARVQSADEHRDPGLGGAAGQGFVLWIGHGAQYTTTRRLRPDRGARLPSREMSSPISFLSDFGSRDEFVGVVHGVLAKLAPGSRVIDVGHGFPRGNVKTAALALTRAIQYLPDGVCLAVVDPGVGTTRLALAVETPWGVFVGPDNGLLSPAVAMVGGASRIVSIENPEAMIPSPGETFHGRDVFAPAAALIAAGDAVPRGSGAAGRRRSVQPMLLPSPRSTGGW